MGAVGIRIDRTWLRPVAALDVDRLHAVFSRFEVRRYLLDGRVRTCVLSPPFPA